MRTRALLIGAFLAIPLTGCGDDNPTSTIDPAPFSVVVTPENIPDAMTGQRCVFLVTIEDEGEGRGVGEAVALSATVTGGTVTIEPQMLIPGRVAEVTVVPGSVITPPIDTLTIGVRGEREEGEQMQTVTIDLQESLTPEDDLRSMAEEIRALFVPWMAEHHPELGITQETEWIPTIVRPNIMVVMFYLFFSEEWEMGVSWHVTREPDNWARIYLRRRFSEIHPSHGFQILSWSKDGEEPYVIDPKDEQYFMTEIWR